ncbi:MAG TPA: hypothetical protein VN933_12975 [Candidatus Eremiobacteraceae bacterium]|nr:hypothetical protein [Candidatus Eremiobacteraceae bacterium]
MSSRRSHPQWRSQCIPTLFLACGLLIAVTAKAEPGGAAPSPAQEQVSRTFQKSLSLGAGGGFSIENKFGEVRIHGESGREVNINATIRVQASSRDEADAYAQKVQIDVLQTGNGIFVRTVYPDEGRRWLHGRDTSYSVNYDIAIPSDSLLTIKNSFGSVTTTSVRGRSDIDNSHGSLTVSQTGPSKLNNSFGSIELRDANGDSFVNDNNGSVDVSGVKGALDLRNRFGSITVKDVNGTTTITGGNGQVTVDTTGAATISTSFGGAEVRNVHGDLMLHDNNGNIEVSSVAGAATITNSFGNVTFSDVKGRVTVSTNNGKVEGRSIGGDSLTVRDSFGSIELENIAGAIDAETTNGKLSLRDARGSVNLRTSFGAIEASNIPKGIRAVTGNGAIELSEIGADTYTKTSYGSITVTHVNGNFTAEDSNGSVTARRVKGDATVTTSFSGVDLEEIGGKISVDNQNGAISVSSRPPNGCRDINLKTSFSSIRVGIPEAGFNLTSHTSFGRINSEVPVTATGNIGGDSLNGTIGSGGCRLQLSNSNGSIEIVKSN